MFCFRALSSDDSEDVGLPSSSSRATMGTMQQSYDADLCRAAAFPLLQRRSVMRGHIQMLRPFVAKRPIAQKVWEQVCHDMYKLGLKDVIE